jgi:RNA polymerase sigma-70 factor (ECF subfamily)
MRQCVAQPDPFLETACPPAAAQQRLRVLVQDNHRFAWRFLRRLGVGPGRLEDAVQQVFLITANRIDDITPGAERSWVVGAVIRVASQVRREARREQLHGEAEVALQPDAAPSPEELADSKRARALLDQVLDAMPDELRVVFVLFELEELTGVEIAGLLELPQGTVASRLRRARETFQAAVKRLRLRREGGHET